MLGDAWRGGTHMIFDIIDRKIKDMKSLRLLELANANQAQQLATDSKYKILIEQVKSFSHALIYARDNLQFSISDTIQPGLLSLLKSLKDAISSGYADKAAVAKTETDYRGLQAIVKKEWNKHFLSYTLTTTNTLKVISGIDSERINGCITDIKAAETWTVDTTVLATLKKAIESANGLISDLNMNQETVLFLTKMTSGKATIADLNENVVTWIKKEGLETKIKLSFLSK